jgi:lipopolysaccharide/colanic/teichoic acid biosynthesis glycosyltransferase
MNLAKRFFDLIIATLLLLLMMPIWSILWLIIRWQFGNPVFFIQNRPGFQGELFPMIKFRSMIDIRDEAGNLLPDEKRLTALGRFLRSTSLDELPELLNVLKGDMSLVGPRPLLVRYLDLYTPKQMRRHDVIPGITGWAQVNGRNSLSWEEKFALDLWYVENQSFWLDLKIILLTIVKILKREGISQPGHVTIQPFTGSQTT